MALAVHRTEVEEFVAERVALFILSEDILQRLGEISKPCSFWPFAIAIVLDQRDVREQARAGRRRILRDRPSTGRKMHCSEVRVGQTAFDRMSP